MQAQLGLEVVVFSDNFDASENSWDLNFEVDAARQAAGRFQGVTYSESPATADGGGADDFTQVNTPDSPGQLELFIGGFIWASPDHNFIEGPQFTIEFEVHPGANNPSYDSPDWAQVVFGASQKGFFVNGSDGMGILFRNNGAIQVFDGNQAIYGSAAGILPQEAFDVRIEAARPCCN